MCLGFSHFIMGTQTTRTDIKAPGFSVNLEINRMDIRQPFAGGMVFRMTDVMAELW